MGVKKNKSLSRYGKDIRLFQKKLERLKLYHGKTDGVFGDVTTDAFNHYLKQKSHAEIHKPVDWENIFHPTKEMSTNEECFLAAVILMAGFKYDPKQDIYYSIIDCWQRHFGYCHLYDELAILAGLVIDIEPIIFEYDNDQWMIELWKGQYCLSCGGEIGIYKKDERVQHYDFYYCVSDEDMMQMKFSLKKNGTEVFNRDELQWWLTGFKPGFFSNLSELTMDISITLKNEQMRDAFVKGMLDLGYSPEDISIDGNAVSFLFAKPYSPQASTRTPGVEHLVQKYNEILCMLFENIKRHLGIESNNPCISIQKIIEHSPELKNIILNFGRNEPLHKYHKIIQDIYS